MCLVICALPYLTLILCFAHLPSARHVCAQAQQPAAGVRARVMCLVIRTLPYLTLVLCFAYLLSAWHRARRHGSRRREPERASATSRRSISMNDNVTRAAAVARASEAVDVRAALRGPVMDEGLPLTAPKAGSGGGGLGSGGKTSAASGSGSDVRTSLRLPPDARSLQQMGHNPTHALARSKCTSWTPASASLATAPACESCFPGAAQQQAPHPCAR